MLNKAVRSQDVFLAQGDLVRLRDKRIDDAENDFSWKSDPELAAFDGAIPYQGTIKNFRDNVSRDLRERTIYRKTFSVEDNQSGSHIGNVMYYGYDPLRREAEIGITIGNKKFWGRGYGREIMSLMLTVMQSRLALSKVYLHTLSWNERAQGAFKAAGFQKVGEVVRGGQTYHRMEVKLPRSGESLD